MVITEIYFYINIDNFHGIGSRLLRASLSASFIIPQSNKNINF